MTTDNETTYTLIGEPLYAGSDGLKYVKHTDGTYEAFPEPHIPFFSQEHEIEGARAFVEHKDIVDGLIPEPTINDRPNIPAPSHVSLLVSHEHHDCTPELLAEFIHYNEELQKMIKACKDATVNGDKLVFKTPLIVAAGTPNEQTQEFVYHHSSKTAHLAHLASVDADQKEFIKHLQETLASQ